MIKEKKTCNLASTTLFATDEKLLKKCELDVLNTTRGLLLEVCLSARFV